MSKLVPVKRMNKHGVMVTKHVRADDLNASTGKPFPPVKPTDDYTSITQILAQQATHFITSILLEADMVPEPVDGQDFGDYCYSRFMTFSGDTLTSICQFGVGADYAGEGLAEYECIAQLVSAGAEEKDFQNTIAMMDYMFEEHELDGESNRIVPVCLALKLYDRHIVSHNGGKEMTLEERLPYYKAFAGVTFAMEEVGPSDSESPDEEFEDDDYYDSDEYSPSILYCHLSQYGTEMGDSPVIEDQQMIDLVIKHVDRALEIEDFIMEREDRDSNLLRDYLEGHPRSISVGML